MLTKVYYDREHDSVIAEYNSSSSVYIAGTFAEGSSGSGCGAGVNGAYFDFPADYTVSGAGKHIFPLAGSPIVKGVMIVKERANNFTCVQGTTISVDRSNTSNPIYITSKIDTAQKAMNAFLNKVKLDFAVHPALQQVYNEEIIPATQSAISKLEDLKRRTNVSDEMINSIVASWNVDIESSLKKVQSANFALTETFQAIADPIENVAGGLGDFLKGQIIYVVIAIIALLIIVLKVKP